MRRELQQLTFKASLFDIKRVPVAAAVMPSGGGQAGTVPVLVAAVI